jgi:hypothetical protein
MNMIALPVLASERMEVKEAKTDGIFCRTAHVGTQTPKDQIQGT